MKITRKQFLHESLKKTGSLLCLSSLLGISKIIKAETGKETGYEIIKGKYSPNGIYFSDEKPVVSIVKINNRWSPAKGMDHAVEKAIDLIGGMETVANGKQRILLKPNLVSPAITDTTKSQVVESLAVLMKKAGKEVLIGEAGAAAIQNVDVSVQGNVCRTKNAVTLNAIQDSIFNTLGYTDLSKKIGVPLVNLHVGRMVKMHIPDNYVFKDIFVHEDMYNADMICSVPMMKTHSLAGVTLALKNVGIGGFPGLVYGTVRSEVHKKAAEFEPTGTSSTIVDMVKANKIGLNIIDASTAMQGNGPSAGGGGELVDMNLIIAGTNALATDMVAAAVMGIGADEIDTFRLAWQAGMKPRNLDDITVVGEIIDKVKKPFRRAMVVPYTMLQDWYGPPCKYGI